MTTLFLYGTLRQPELVDRLLGCRPPTRPATLPGWRAARLRDLPYPGLVPAPDGGAVGELIEVDDRQLAVLDRFEGPMYERIGVRVVTPGPPPTTGDAHVWRLRDEHHDLVLASDWQLDRYLSEDAGWFLGGG